MRDDQFLTTEDVLEYLQINLRTVYRLIKAGRIPAVRIGRQWRFRREDVDAWLAGNRSTSPSPSPDRPPRILVVDDEALVLDLLRSTLQRAGYEVQTASDGPTAVEWLRKVKFDLLITDVRMPRMDGLSLVRETRRQSATMPIVIITGESSEATAIEAINLGVTGYLTKPFGMERVLSVTARSLRESFAPSVPG